MVNVLAWATATDVTTKAASKALVRYCVWDLRFIAFSPSRVDGSVERLCAINCRADPQVKLLRHNRIWTLGERLVKARFSQQHSRNDRTQYDRTWTLGGPAGRCLPDSKAILSPLPW